MSRDNYVYYEITSAQEEDDAQGLLLGNGFRWCGSGASHEHYIKGRCTKYYMGIDWDRMKLCMGSQSSCEYKGYGSYDDLCNEVYEWEQERASDDEYDEDEQEGGWMVQGKSQIKQWVATPQSGGDTMGLNTTIAQLFDKTADAVLVNKWFNGQIAQNDVEVVKLKGKEKELLAAAQAKEDAQKAAREHDYC